MLVIHTEIQDVTVTVIGGDIKVGYGLAQLWDWNKIVIDLVKYVDIRNGVMVIGSKA